MLYKAHLPLSGVAGVMVSIVAFQAVDPGSIPGPRSLFTKGDGLVEVPCGVPA